MEEHQHKTLELIMGPSDITSSREKCGGCSKNILMHNPVSICSCCSKPIHAKCAKNFLRYNSVNDTWACKNCVMNAPKRYNPFATHVNYFKAGSEPVHVDSDVYEISKILNSCQTYTPDQLDSLNKNKREPPTNEFSVFLIILMVIPQILIHCAQSCHQ